MAAPLELFDYQTGILELLRAGFAQGHRSQILVAPTGAGKTEMAIALLQAASSFPKIQLPPTCVPTWL